MNIKFKSERFERTEENVDNRIQYVGQIASEGKHLQMRNAEFGMRNKTAEESRKQKKTKVKISSNVKKR